MVADREEALRRAALGLFGATVALVVLSLWLAAGLSEHLADGVRPPMDLGFAVAGSAVAVTGLLLAWVRPRNALGWLLQGTALVGALCQLGQTYGSRALELPGSGLPFGAAALSVSAPLWIPALVLPASVILLRYPSGRLSGPWARRLDRAVILGLVLVWAGYAGSEQSVTDAVPTELPPVLLPGAVGGVLLAVGAVLTLGGTAGVAVDTVVRLLRSGRPERQQLTWLLTAAVLPRGWAPEVVAASLVAVGLVPVRERLQRAVDRLVYGDRADPWRAMKRLGVPVGGNETDLLPAVVQALGESLRLPGVGVVRPDGTVAARTGDSLLSRGAVRVPLLLGGRPLGALVAVPRSGESHLSETDRRLLDTVAPLLAVALHTVDLTAQLRAERARVLDAASQERGRLRRDLHDGLGPSLTGVGLGLEALETRLSAAPDAPSELVARLRSEVSSSIEEVRRILDDLRPAALDELGLVGALRRRAGQLAPSGVEVSVSGPAGSLGVAPEVEAAAYRIADEALANVVRHAQASRCTVAVHLDDEGLHVLVADDGIGIPRQRDGGLGLPSMRSRAEQLGGRFAVQQSGSGTTVVADLPCAGATPVAAGDGNAGGERL